MLHWNRKVRNDNQRRTHALSPHILPFLLGFVMALLLLPGCGGGGGQGTTGQSRAVVVNGVSLTPADVTQVEANLHQPIQPGNYWYDSRSGAWGAQGGRTFGFTLPGITVGGSLRSDASNGHSGVFVNGRELPTADVQALAQIGLQVPTGRWWLNANGDFGAEGDSFPSGNLIAVSQQARAHGNTGGGSWNFYNDGVAASGSGGEMSAYFRDSSGGYVSWSSDGNGTFND